MDVHERHEWISRRLGETGRLTVSEAAETLRVSGMTVRRDLTALEERGVLRRIRGGAIASERRADFGDRKIVQRAEKTRIARAVAQLIRPGESILLDIGTTTSFVARELVSKRGLSIWTNSVNAAVELAGSPNTVNLVGGRLYGDTDLSLVGPLAEEVFARFRVDKLIMSAAGLHPQRGYVYIDLEETQVRRAMLGAANTVIMALDQTKIGRDSFVSLGPSSLADLLVTDAPPPADALASIQDGGTEVLVAGCDGGTAGSLPEVRG